MNSTPTTSASPVNGSYLSLGTFYYRYQTPTPVAEPQWIAYNERLADKLGLTEAPALPTAIFV